MFNLSLSKPFLQILQIKMNHKVATFFQSKGNRVGAGHRQSPEHTKLSHSTLCRIFAVELLNNIKLQGRKKGTD